MSDQAERLANCLDCGAPYGEDGWCDVVIPSPIWNQIAKPSDTLCFRCMTKRIEAAGLKNVPVVVASGPYSDANGEWHLIGWDHGYSVGMAERDALQKRVQGLEAREQIRPYTEATKLAMNLGQTVGPKNEYYVTLRQLEEICKGRIGCS